MASEPANLILITVDTLRADHVSVYNPDSPVPTPNIDRLAQEGVQFANVSTTNPLTFPAHASLLTGSWPMAHGVRDFTGSQLPESAVTMAEILGDAGYRTTAFVSAAVLDDRTGLGQGFDHYDDGFSNFLGSDAQVAERAGSETLARAKEWLKVNREEPVFMWVHLFEPHDPYEPPEAYLKEFSKNPYAGEVAYTDALLGGFFSFLADNDVWNSSLVMLVSDHGEGLGDHGESRHGFFVYQSTMAVPWILKLPRNERAGSVVKDNVSLVDALPTLLQILEVKRSSWPASIQGKSRLGAIVSDREFREPVYMESLTPYNQFGWSPLKSLRLGRHKVIDAPVPELYDLEADPDEKKNLFSENRSLGLQVLESLRKFEVRFGTETAKASELDSELEARLRSLGYVGVSSPAPAASSDSDLPDPKSKIEVYELAQSGVEAARGQNFVVAISRLSRAAQLAPNSVGILTSLALAYRDAGRVSMAEEIFDRLFELRPEDIGLRLEYARSLLQVGKTAKARTQLEAVLREDPENFKALYNLGTLEGRASNFARATELFRQAVEVRRDPEALRSLGLALLYSGDAAAAEEPLLNSLAMQPDPATHSALSQVYQKMGQPEKARHHAALARQNR